MASASSREEVTTVNEDLFGAGLKVRRTAGFCCKDELECLRMDFGRLVDGHRGSAEVQARLQCIDVGGHTIHYVYEERSRRLLPGG